MARPSFVALLFLLLGSVASAFEARVLIDEESLDKEIRGAFSVFCVQPATDCVKNGYAFADAVWQVYLSKNKLRIQSPGQSRVYRMSGEHFRLSGEFQVNGHKVNGLELQLLDGKPQWVVVLPIDQYLYGVLSSEVPVSWPIESLKAQAVAARSYFLFKKQQSAQQLFDVRSDILDQVFSFDATRHQSILRAVDETHGEVLMFPSGARVFPAYYHSDCGGHTSNEKQVWAKPKGHNAAVADPVCESASKNNWTFKINRSRLRNLLQKLVLVPAGIQVKKILPRVQAAGRAYEVDMLFTDESLKRVSANELRQVLGFGKLKSANFSIEETWNEVIFTGRGFGHGVGMCQWGAQRWARKGKDYKEILRHYYPNASLQKKVTQRSLAQCAEDSCKD